ncbi:hypothetical protein [Paraburkholderia sediminicola]|uniref:hypothetical protein n=1 Tax=Paraburkholderia sediminicola TaxID=458836 RepID=UPI0038BA4DFD
MARTSVAERLAKTPELAGVKRIWGATDDSLNRLRDALRRMNRIQWPHVRHDEVAARCAASGALAYPLPTGAGQPHPGWASMSILIVSRESVDAPRHSIVGRVIGMIAGAAVAVGQYNQTIVSALKDISDQIVTLQSFDPQRAATQRSVTVARKSYDLESTGFKSVLADYLSVLTAETQLLRAQRGAAAKTIQEAAR